MLTIGQAPHAIEFVSLAAVVCLLSGWAASRAIAREGAAKTRLRRLFAIAGPLGLGVWSTHFIAILGLRPDFLIEYAVLETIASIAIAIAIAGGAMTWAANRRHRASQAIGAGVSGAAVSLMHHVGMLGLSGCVVAFDPFSVGVSTTAVAVLFSASLGIAKSATRFKSVKAAGLMSLGVVTLHFGSIAGTTIEIGPSRDVVISSSMLSVLQLIAFLAILSPTYRIARATYETYREAQLSGHVAMATGEGVVKMDADGKVLWVSSAFEDLTGLKLNQLVGRSSAKIIRSVADNETADRYEDAIAGGTPLKIMIEASRPTGESYWQELRLIPLRRDGGQVVGFVSAHRDVTSELIALKRMERSEAEARQLALVAEYANDAILIADENGRAIWGNASFYRLSGFDRDEIIGRKPGTMLQGRDTDPETVREIGRALMERRPIRCEILNYSRSRKPYWIELEIAPVERSPDPLRFVAVSRDVSERVERELNLQEARRRAEAADKTKSEFLARMSHEIRTPMNGVTGMAELLATTALDKDQAVYLSHIRSSSDRMLRLVDDILDFSSLEAGAVTFRTDPFSIRDLTRETINVVQAQADAKQLRLHVRVSPEAPDLVLGDDGRLQQVLLNLLTNAIRYTQKGEVELDVAAIGVERVCGGEVVRLRFAISDTGIGIPKAMRSTIFDRFSQVDGSARRTTEGAGLGLSIAAGLVEAMGGRIVLESEEDEGSRFSFALAFEKAEVDESAKPLPVVAR